MNMKSLSPLMPDSFKSIIHWYVKLGPNRRYIRFHLCVDTGSYFNVLPLALVEKMGMNMNSNHTGLTATEVNGGDLSIKGVVTMVILVGDGSRKRVSFIVCNLPPGKEPLLNVETSMALGILPNQFPEGDYTTGKKYEEEDIVHIFGGTGAFDMEADRREEEPEFDELGFNIKRTIQRIKRESTVKGRT